MEQWASLVLRTYPFNEKKVHDEESIQLLTSGGTQLLGESTVNSICDRRFSPTGKNFRFPDPLIIMEGVLDKLGESNCLGLHVSNNPLQKIPRGQPKIWCLFGT